jgi:hypothetical protein
LQSAVIAALRSNLVHCHRNPADKDDCAVMVVKMCRTQRMTRPTTAIDAERVFIKRAAPFPIQLPNSLY